MLHKFIVSIYYQETGWAQYPTFALGDTASEALERVQDHAQAMANGKTWSVSYLESFHKQTTVVSLDCLDDAIITQPHGGAVTFAAFPN